MSASRLHKVVASLVKEQIGSQGTVRFRVASDSMAPLLQTGDALIVEGLAPEACQVGDVIVIQRERDYLTHRLIHKSGAGFLTKGDNLLPPDPCSPPGAIIGRVIQIQRGETRIPLTTRQQRWSGALLAKLGALEWQAFKIYPALRLPLRLAIKLVQRYAAAPIHTRGRRHDANSF